MKHVLILVAMTVLMFVMSLVFLRLGCEVAFGWFAAGSFLCCMAAICAAMLERAGNKMKHEDNELRKIADSKQPWHTKGYTILAGALMHLWFTRDEIPVDDFKAAMEVISECGRKIRREHK